MGAILTIPPAAYLLAPVIKVDLLGQSDVAQGWREVGPVAEVPEDEPKVYVVEFPIDQIYASETAQEQFPETPRSQREFTVRNAIWLSWKAPILEQGDIGNIGDRIGEPEKPEFLKNGPVESLTQEQRRIVKENLNVLSNSCAHLGCPVRWLINADGHGEFLCPCHGGIYDINGNWFGGPPPRGMYRYTQTEVRENGILYAKHEFDIGPGIPGLSTTKPYVI